MRITQEKAAQIFKDLDEIIERVHKKYPINPEKLAPYKTSKETFVLIRNADTVQFNLIIQTLQTHLIAHLQSMDPQWTPPSLKPLRKNEDPMLRIKAITTFIDDLFGNTPRPENAEVTTPSDTASTEQTGSSNTTPETPEPMPVVDLALTEGGDTTDSPTLNTTPASVINAPEDDLSHLANSNSAVTIRPRNNSRRAPTKPRSVTRRDVTIADGQDKPEETAPFSDLINDKITAFEQVILTFNGINPGTDVLNEEDFPADIVLIPSIQKFKRIQIESYAWIKQTRSHIETARHSNDKRDELEKNHIPEAIKKLLEHNLLLENLQKQIGDRRDILAPKTNNKEELEALRNNVLAILKTQFRQFILTFIMVKTIKTMSNEPLPYVDSMAEFIGVMDYFLCDKSLPADEAIAKKLCSALIEHLGKGKKFQVTKLQVIDSPQNCLTPEAAIELLDQLFPEENWFSKLLNSSIKPQIADAHIFLSKIEAFFSSELQEILKHNLKQTLILELYKELQETFEIQEIIKPDVEILSKTLSYYEDNGNNDIMKARELINNKLPAALEPLHAHQEQFELTKRTFVETDLTSLQAHIDFMENCGKKLKVIIQEIQVVHHQICKLIPVIDGQYEIEKKRNLDQLETAIVNARAVYQYANVNIDTIVEPALDLYTQIEKNLNIPISKDVQATCDLLGKHTAERRVDVTAKLRQKMNAVISKIKPSPEISSENPFREEYEKVCGEVDVAKTALLGIFPEHHKLEGQALLTWITNGNFAQGIKELEAQIQDQDCKARKVNLFEVRLENPVYLSSLTALEILKKEFEKIIDTGFPDTSEKNRSQLREQLKTVLTMDDEVLAQNDELDQALKQSDKLIAIRSLFSQFIQINSVYLNKNSHLLSDKHYLENLIDQISITLTSLQQLPKEEKGNWLYHFFKPLLDLFCCCFAEPENEKKNTGNSRFHKSKTSDETYSTLFALGQELEELTIKKEQDPQPEPQPRTPYDPRLFQESVSRRSMSIRSPVALPLPTISQP